MCVCSAESECAYAAKSSLVAVIGPRFQRFVNVERTFICVDIVVFLFAVYAWRNDVVIHRLNKADKTYNTGSRHCVSYVRLNGSQCTKFLFIGKFLKCVCQCVKLNWVAQLCARAVSYNVTYIFGVYVKSAVCVFQKL